MTAIRIHDLRHTAATWQLQNGVAVATVSARLGHKRTSMTHDTYGHLLEGDQDTAASIAGIVLFGNRKTG